MKRPKEGFDQQLYWVWAAMIQRCHNPTNKSYGNYGARGITVCERWHEYANFIADVGPRPAGMSIDRIDNNKGYEPKNVRWADVKMQASNRRYCTMIDDAGESVTLKEYCRRHDLNYRAINKRIKKRTWSVEDALTIPVGAKVWGINRKIDQKPIGNLRYETAFGRTQSVAEWAREYHFTRGALMRRLHLGWTIEEALALPMNFRTTASRKSA